MIKFILVVSVLLMARPSFAQPSQEEMQRLLQQAQNELDKLDPNTKKMMDSLGIKMPDLKKTGKQVAGVTDRQLKTAYEEETRILPLKDAARIAAISKTPLTEATLPAYIQSVNQLLPKALGQEVVTLGNDVYQQIKTEYKTETATGNAGAGLWMFGNPQLALHVMSKAVKADMHNDDNINNFAAMLTMAGGEQFALPLLNYLDKKYPSNSTVLNNTAQAWFGLGDMAQAVQYAAAALKLAPYHPQANLIMAKIEESKGNGIEASVYVKKAIKENYTEEKEEELRKDGGKLTGDDIKWPFPPEADALGLNDFKHPPYPMSVAECIASEKIWHEFREMCKQEIRKLNEQLVRASEVLKTNMLIRVKDDPFAEPFYYKKALPKLESVMNDYDGANHRFDRAGQDKGTYIMAMIPTENKYKQQIEQLNEIEGNQTGAEMANKDYCPEKQAAANDFLGRYNSGLQEKDDAILEKFRKLLNDQATWSQYTEWEDQFEVSKIGYKMGWLGMLSELDFKSITLYKCAKPKPTNGDKLAAFKDPRCKQSTTLYLPTGTITNTCDKLDTKLNLKVLKIELKQDFGTDKTSFWDHFVSCTVELGVSKGAGLGAGPIKVEAKVGAAVFAEIGKHGVEDWGVKVKGEIKLGTNGTEKTLQNGTEGVSTVIKDADKQSPALTNLSIPVIGAEVKISINSGVSVKGKGILSPLNKK